ncbi:MULTISPECIES: hypothetical protein [Micromonospora]|uniref:Uncharacterized protein n=1 Tax=Micromonospora yangpuensis TaxID=683228 RepID=A0A1C6U0G4_9ACTN|nr:hypothetical protein [Micromonospora yangpuensis]GGM11728.1 hypothetical protein GCM10012279_32330 [Micromonospora yangpuensis]SCL47534.1 hypothetical protein GA0070617_0611 [Micromonospora yangpuensis]
MLNAFVSAWANGSHRTAAPTTSPAQPSFDPAQAWAAQARAPQYGGPDPTAPAPSTSTSQGGKGYFYVVPGVDSEPSPRRPTADDFAEQTRTTGAWPGQYLKDPAAPGRTSAASRPGADHFFKDGVPPQQRRSGR